MIIRFSYLSTFNPNKQGGCRIFLKENFFLENLHKLIFSDLVNYRIPCYTNCSITVCDPLLSLSLSSPSVMRSMSLRASDGNVIQWLSNDYRQRHFSWKLREATCRKLWSSIIDNEDDNHVKCRAYNATYIRSHLNKYSYFVTRLNNHAYATLCLSAA